ncbi:MAG: RNA polymerase sigma-70 factor [Bacteroidia bacterium]|nr:RNA polymerase sigma-70 factor [Bacteroidia bacterium]
MENDDIEIKFRSFFNSNFPKVKNFALMLLKSEFESEDVAQDVFFKLWQQPALWLDHNNDMDNYLFIMTRNMILNIFKHQRIEQDYREESLDKEILYELTGQEDVLTNMYYKDLLMLVHLTLDRMPKRRRQIFELSRFKGLSHKDIAEKLGVSIRTVEHQIYLALIELKKILLFVLLFFIKF